MSKLDQLIEVLMKAPKNVYIQPHNVPDPDAISSCLGVQYLLKQRGIEAKICYTHAINKANSLKMLDIFQVDMGLAEEFPCLSEEDYIILIDSQKGNSNVTDLIGDEIAVIDHHEDSNRYSYKFKDVRPNVGACASIISEYFYENKISVPVNIATALLYGIMLDTDYLTRGTSKLDIEMFYWLYGKANIDLIKHLQLNQIEKEDLSAYASALDNVEIYDNVGFVHLKNCNDALLGTISDMVTTISDVTIAVSYATREDGIKFSVRSGEKEIQANYLVRHLLEECGFGGGHDEMAGGFIPSSNFPFFKNKKLDTYIRYKTIDFLEK